MKKFLRITARTTALLFAIFLVVEVAYRYQWWDFYAAEWEYFNEGKMKENAQREILVMGDSFTTSDSGYVDQLRSHFPEWNLANGGVPGTGVIEASYMVGRRMGQRKPDTFIYQIYLGNDLFDMTRPVNWGELGTFRNMFWWWANRFRAFGWINYKMGQFQAAPAASGSWTEAPFSPEVYNPREKRFFQSDPNWLRKQALPESSDYASDRESYINYLEDLLEEAADANAKVLLLVIPHCAHLGQPYVERMEALGMREGSPLDVDEDHAWLEAIATAAQTHTNVEMLFPLEALKQAERSGGPVYYQNDLHLNASGQTVIAEEVAAWLTQNPK